MQEVMHYASARAGSKAGLAGGGCLAQLGPPGIDLVEKVEGGGEGGLREGTVHGCWLGSSERTIRRASSTQEASQPSQSPLPSPACSAKHSARVASACCPPDSAGKGRQR